MGTETTRVFVDVADVGRALAGLDDVAGTAVPAPVAVVYDRENRWAVGDSQGPLSDGRKGYERTCKDHHYPLWKRGIPLDVVDQTADPARHPPRDVLEQHRRRE